MTDDKIEAIEFDNLKVIIRRQQTEEMFIALQPPDALPYIVAPLDKKPEEIVAFVQHWLTVIRELRSQMIKRFEKSPSLKCHYQTGDVAYLFGRPFMLRVYSLSATKGSRKGTRGRANVKATIRSEISVIDLFLLKEGDFDQGRSAFLAFAKPVFARNVEGLVQQCMARVFPDTPVPSDLKIRPLRNSWIQVDETKNAFWFSESLIPYPPECTVYVFLNEMIRIYAPQATQEERHELLERGLPQWQQIKKLLADPDNPYSRQ